MTISHVHVCEEIRKSEKEWRDSIVAAIGSIRSATAKLDNDMTRKYEKIYDQMWKLLITAFSATIGLAVFLIARLLHWV